VSNTFTLRPASYEDIVHVANNLRPLDHEEFVAYTGRSPERVMADAVFPSGTARCGCVNGEPAAIYGVDDTPEVTLPWMVGTPALEGLAFGRFLLRTGRELFAGWAEEHGTLTNYAYAKNTLHIKFIRLLGCEVGDPQPYGALRLPFRKFTYVPSTPRSRPDVNVSRR
jgi:hypothetical protein